MAPPPSVANRPSVVSSTLAANRLGIMHVVFFVITAAAPLTVIAGVVSTGWLVTDIKGLPLAFLVVAVVLALFCVGYVAVARRIRNAGAFYTYIAKGLGKPLGVGGSFVALVSYGMMQWATYGAIGFTVSTLIHDKTGATVQWWIFALIAWALVAGMGLLRVDLNSKVLAVALVAEVVVVVVFDIIDVAHPFGGTVSFTTLAPSSLLGSGLGIALAIAITGFIGFEAAAVFSEESRESDRTVPAATYLSLAVMAVLYAVSAWAMSVAIGPDNLHKAAEQYSSTLPGAIVAAKLGGSIAVDIGQLLFVTSLVAAALSYHGTCSRYTFALGRERVLPAFLGRTGVRSNAPKFASLLQSTIGLVLIALFAITHADPLVNMFFTLGTVGGFGVLLLITGTSFSIIGFLARNPEGETLWQRLIAPVLASIGLLIIVTLILLNFDLLLGAPGTPLRFVFPIVFALLWIGGVVWALFLRNTRPGVYAAIGLGAAATSAAPFATSNPPPSVGRSASRRSGR